MAGLSRWVWLLPLVSAIAWLAMLLALLIHWISAGSPHLPSMKPDQKIAFISNVGAADYKPLFIALSTVSIVAFDLGFIAERCLRHTGYLVRNTSIMQRLLSILAIIFSVIGGAGGILLTIFDTYRHRAFHFFFLAVFIGCYVFCAVCTCLEHWRLGVHFPQYRILRVSFWMKLVFIFMQVFLAVVFGLLNRIEQWDGAAVIEWIVSLVYSIWVVSFIIDFLPSATSSHHDVDGYPSGASGSGGMTNGVNLLGGKEERTREIV